MDDVDLARYARQTVFLGIGPEGQRRLLAARVLIVGCGALGSVAAGQLVRAGVGETSIVDRDFVELNNLQRQTLFDETDIARNLPKAVAAAEKLARVNSSVTVTPVVADVNPANAEELVAAADLVVDGTDNFETRYLINDVCVKLGKPWIYGGVISSYGMTMSILPGSTPCLRCLFLDPPMPGLTPTCDTAGVLAPIVNVIASLQTAEALKLLVGATDRLNPGLVHVDVWHNTFLQHSVGLRSSDCPTCVKHDFEFLEAREGVRTTTLCGRDAVQVAPSRPTKVSFPDLARRLSNAGDVAFNEFMLRLKVGGHELTIFPDGRTIVKGTADESVAKTLHAKYVGA